jgi:hypothetical protein
MQAPVSVNGVALPDKYALDMAYDEKFTVGVTRVFESDALSFRVSGLSPETDYWLRLSPHNAAGYGEAVVAKVRTETVSAVGPGGADGGGGLVSGGAGARDDSCPNDCSGNGICFKATRTCTCLPGYEGIACNHASRVAAAPEIGPNVVVAAAAKSKPTDKPYCAELCGESCSPACRKYCKVTCPSLNSAPYAICQSKCEVCSADCTKICPEACPNLAAPVPPAAPALPKTAAAAEPASAEAKVSVQKETITAVEDSAKVQDRVLECARRGADGVCVKFHWNVSPTKKSNRLQDAKIDAADDEWNLNDEELTM